MAHDDTITVTRSMPELEGHTLSTTDPHTGITPERWDVLHVYMDGVLNYLAELGIELPPGTARALLEIHLHVAVHQRSSGVLPICTTTAQHQVTIAELTGSEHLRGETTYTLRAALEQDG